MYLERRHQRKSSWFYWQSWDDSLVLHAWDQSSFHQEYEWGLLRLSQLPQVPKKY